MEKTWRVRCCLVAVAAMGLFGFGSSSSAVPKAKADYCVVNPNGNHACNWVSLMSPNYVSYFHAANPSRNWYAVQALTNYDRPVAKCVLMRKTSTWELLRQVCMRSHQLYELFGRCNCGGTRPAVRNNSEGYKRIIGWAWH